MKVAVLLLVLLPAAVCAQVPADHAAGRYISIWRREGPGWRLVVSMLNSPTKEFQ